MNGNEKEKEQELSVLHLVLKYEWYDKIASGEKTTEYRECSDYWNQRLKNKQFSGLLKECRTLCKEMIKVNRLYIQGKCICPCKENITDILTRINAALGKNERPDNG